MNILEIKKIKYLIRLSFRYTKQTKQDFFANFGNYLKDHRFPANGYQNVKFCDIPYSLF